MKLVLFLGLVFIALEIVTCTFYDSGNAHDKVLATVITEFERYSMKKTCDQSNKETRIALKDAYDDCISRFLDKRKIGAVNNIEIIRPQYESASKRCAEEHGYLAPIGFKEACAFVNNAKVYEPHADCIGRKTVEFDSKFGPRPRYQHAKYLRKFEACVHLVKVTSKPGNIIDKGWHRLPEVHAPTESDMLNVKYAHAKAPTDSDMLNVKYVNESLRSYPIYKAKENVVAEAFLKFVNFTQGKVCEETTEEAQTKIQERFDECIVEVFDKPFHEDVTMKEAFDLAPRRCGDKHGYHAPISTRSKCELHKIQKLFIPHADCIGMSAMIHCGLPVEIMYEHLPRFELCVNNADEKFWKYAPEVASDTKDIKPAGDQTGSQQQHGQPKTSQQTRPKYQPLYQKDQRYDLPESLGQTAPKQTMDLHPSDYPHTGKNDAQRKFGQVVPQTTGGSQQTIDLLPKAFEQNGHHDIVPQTFGSLQQTMDLPKVLEQNGPQRKFDQVVPQTIGGSQQTHGQALPGNKDGSHQQRAY